MHVFKDQNKIPMKHEKRVAEINSMNLACSVIRSCWFYYLQNDYTIQGFFWEMPQKPVSAVRIWIFITEGFVCEPVFSFQVVKIKVQPQNKSWQLVDSSSSRDTTSTSQTAFVFNCSSTKTNNRHVFALRNVSLRECISIIHVSECVCVCVSKQGKKKRKEEGLSVPFNSFPLMASKHLQTIRQLLRGRCISTDEKRCAFPVEKQRTADTQQYSCSRVLAQKHKRRTVL